MLRYETEAQMRCFESQDGAEGVRAFLRKEGEEALPPMRLRVYRPAGRNDAESSGGGTCTFDDLSWNTKTIVGFNASLQRISDQPLGMSVVEIC